MISRRNAAAIRAGILAARRSIGMARHLTAGHLTIRVQGGHYERAVRHTIARTVWKDPTLWYQSRPKVRVVNR